MIEVQESKEGITFTVRVQTRSSRTEIVGVVDGVLKVALREPPLDGRANEACRKLVAKELGVSKSRVMIKTGVKSRQKVIVVEGVTKNQLQEWVVSNRV